MAKIAFTAYDMSIYGTVDGTVTKVAPSTTQENPNDPSYYECIIEINTSDLRKEGKKISLQSGMLAEVSIIGEDRTVLSYVINPLSKCILGKCFFPFISLLIFRKMIS